MRNIGNLSEWTKIELAQVIYQALENTPQPFPADHFKVQRMAKRHNKDFLIRTCDTALSAMK